MAEGDARIDHAPEAPRVSAAVAAHQPLLSIGPEEPAHPLAKGLELSICPRLAPRMHARRQRPFAHEHPVPLRLQSLDRLAPHLKADTGRRLRAVGTAATRRRDEGLGSARDWRRRCLSLKSVLLQALLRGVAKAVVEVQVHRDVRVGELPRPPVTKAGGKVVPVEDLRGKNKGEKWAEGRGGGVGGVQS